ncbi:PAS domain-containing hybrid sensor histidine kinase/response regulator [Coralliovum pocilloporae]|uniref:PAS domain-containing hybrid sensor histidine kinase/response regulator n=1 Tax=Coralliovum pocilloporae TaxID=3066369 RepID=UPI003306E1CF
MLQGWVVASAALLYMGALFAIASWGDRMAVKGKLLRSRPIIYSLSLAIYCTSWTFFGSVGLAASTGYDFLTIYIGPIIVLVFGFPLIRRVIRLSKAERITSIADFIAARYGKSQAVAAVVTLIAVVGVLPYLSLQLQAVAVSVETLVAHMGYFTFGIKDPNGPPITGDIALYIALAMALFAVLFGTRHIDATEHQDGLMLAVATESLVKLFAFLIVGAYVTFIMFDGVGDLITQAAARPHIRDIFSQSINGSTWTVMILLSTTAILLLPRQFHVTVVENASEKDLKWASYLFPLYLVLINLPIIPIALAGLLKFGGTGVNADMFVLALPMSAEAELVTLITFIGGLSAATAMVIVAAVTLSIMISNDIVMPIVLRNQKADSPGTYGMASLLMVIRRGAIFGLLFLAYLYYRLSGEAALAAIGLLWRRGTARGAIAGLTVGFAFWFYTLLLPSFAQSGLISSGFVENGPFGLNLLRPQALFGISSLDPLTHGVLWSLTLNVLVYFLVSFSRAPEPVERIQAGIFVPSDLTPVPAFRYTKPGISTFELRATVARYLGDERTDRSFERFSREYGIDLSIDQPASSHVLRFAEQLLASAIGAPSARLVLMLVLKKNDPSPKGAKKLLDDASAAIQYNRDLLHSALEHVEQGIGVFDSELQLIIWNRQFRHLLDLPTEFGQVGMRLDQILRHHALQATETPEAADALVEDRIRRIAVDRGKFQETIPSRDIVLDVSVSAIPDGGLVITLTDISDRVRAADALAQANVTLERRVRERTEELTHLNEELTAAKSDADAANLGKTRFLAAVGHDVAQPLNAARLYTSSLSERFENGREAEQLGKINASLDAVDDILGAVLDISRLDTGAMQPDKSIFSLGELLEQLRVDFEPQAAEKDLDLRILSTSVNVNTDRRLLRRLLQNLISNAIKYTPEGRVLVGCRRGKGRVSVQVLDTGVGIPEEQQNMVFQEFQRLDQGARIAPGLGLGLSIVDRITRVLDVPVTLSSIAGKGTVFSFDLKTIGPAVPLRTVQTQAKPKRARSRFDGLVVLCIDNEADILDGMQALLEGWGCEVYTASSYHEAVDVVGRLHTPPNIMLVDYHLDSGSGPDAVVKLRWKFDMAFPAILITADRSNEVKQEAAQKDMPVLNKPIKPAALRAILTHHTSRHAAAE